MAFMFENPSLPPPPPPLMPMPQADSPLIAGWLRRVRLGAIIGFVMAMYNLVYFTLWMSGFSLGRTGLYVLSQITSIVAAVGVWLIILPEPGSGKWFWFARWVIRIGLIITFVLTTALVVRYGIFPTSPETKQFDWNLISMTQGIIGVCWVLAYYFYLRNLAMRLGDRTLKANFSVLAWFTVVVLVLGVLAIILLLIFYFVVGTKAGAEPTSVPVEVKKEVNVMFKIVFKIIFGSIISMFSLWVGWLMWRLSRRLNAAAEKVLVERTA